MNDKAENEKNFNGTILTELESDTNGFEKDDTSDRKLLESGSLPKDEHSGEDENTVRGNWGSQVEFMLSLVGYAVGLGNLWRFPYLCMRNGGGAFLIPYFFFLFVCGVPLFLLEVSLGQFSSSSPLSVWNICPLFKGIGYGMLIMSFIFCNYYNMIFTWVLYYLFRSFTSVLPWSHCQNTTICFEERGNQSLLSNVSYTNGSYMFGNMSLAMASNSSFKKMSAAEEFWQFEVLNLSSGIDNLGSIRWQLLLCLLLAWILIFMCLFKGVKSFGKVVYVSATLPYLLLLVLLIRGLTLDGAVDGIKFYIVPDFSKLWNLQVWGEAALQIFYSLGPAWGGLITMSSYNRFHHNILREAVLVPLINSFTSFFAGFVIFSVIGFMAKNAGVEIKDVVTSGPGLAFVVYPEAISKLPISPLWAIIFFLMLLTLGLDTLFSTFETVVSSLVDEFPKYLRGRQVLLCGTLCCVQFVIGLPLVTEGGMYVFQILDWYTGAYTMMVIAFAESIIVSWVYGATRFRKEIAMMLGYMPTVVWEVFWRVVTPLVILGVTVFNLYGYRNPTYGTYKFPSYMVAIGWSIATLSTLPIPLYMIYAVATAEGTLLQRLKTLIRPTESWGPWLEKFRVHYDSQHGPTMPIEYYTMKQCVDNSEEKERSDLMAQESV